jgi:hypothetical protein
LGCSVLKLRVPRKVNRCCNCRRGKVVVPVDQRFFSYCMCVSCSCKHVPTLIQWTFANKPPLHEEFWTSTGHWYLALVQFRAFRWEETEWSIC